MLGKGKRVGDYVLLEKLGAGGFGEVWKAEKRTELSTSYFALKFFRPKDDDAIDVEIVKKEIQTWQNLSGLPNVISVIEANRFEDYVFIVSEFAEGGSLEKWLKANGGKASSHEEAVTITRQILQGLEGMHGEGFVHRDLKPANVLLKRGAFYLADFGISRQMKTHSKTNSTAGTYEFMPPEAFEKSPSVTPQTDIWAVGAILQVLLTGQLPFPQDEIPSLITAILYNEPEPLPESLPLALREIVKKSLEKKREDRFQTAREMREVLRNALTAKKIVESPRFSQVATFVVEDSDKTAKYEIAATKDWQAIEAEKEQQREREEARWLKEAEEAKRLQALRLQRQAEKERLKREKEEKEQRERSKKQRSAKIRQLLLGIIAVILSPFIIALVWTKPWETDNQPIGNISTNQNSNDAGNKPLNMDSNQSANLLSNNSTKTIANKASERPNNSLKNQKKINDNTIIPPGAPSNISNGYNPDNPFMPDDKIVIVKPKNANSNKK